MSMRSCCGTTELNYKSPGANKVIGLQNGHRNMRTSMALTSALFHPCVVGIFVGDDPGPASVCSAPRKQVWGNWIEVETTAVGIAAFFLSGGIPRNTFILLKLTFSIHEHRCYQISQQISLLTVNFFKSGQQTDTSSCSHLPYVTTMSTAQPSVSPTTSSFGSLGDQ
uniref:Uncharacterized protein n=1 Tax=Mesocestoides corti TaxID=53468 RepID=A0A5K3G6A5_MESCO